MFDLIDISTAAAMLLVAARMGGLVLAAPVLAHRAVPARVRVVLALAMAWAMAGRVQVAVPADVGALVTAVLGEVAVGAAIGLAASAVFAGVQLAAVHVGQQLGVGLIEALNPTVEPEDEGATARLFEILAIVIFLAIGGHRALIGGLLATFRTLPVGLDGWRPELLTTVIGLLSVSFGLAIKLACPVIVTLLVATVAMGILQRSVLGLNILSVGFPIYAMLGLLTLAAAVGVMTPLIDEGWKAVSGQLAAWTNVKS